MNYSMKISGTIVILKYLVSRLIFQILLRNLAHKFFLDIDINGDNKKELKSLRKLGRNLEQLRLFLLRRILSLCC